MPVSAVKGIGGHTCARLEKLGIANLFDVLIHAPLRYEDRTRITPLDRLWVGLVALTEGVVEGIELAQGRRRSAVCRIAANGASLHLRFFHYTSHQLRSFTPGVRVRCFGEVRPGPYGREMVHPEYHLVSEDASAGLEGHLTPVYPTTEGMRQTTLRALVREALNRVTEGDAPLDDFLPVDARPSLRHPGLAESLRLLHRPVPGEEPLLAAARERLAFEELLAHRLGLMRLRAETRRQRAPALRLPERLDEAFTSCLSFPLTRAQQRVNAEIEQDLSLDRPMMRLLQGDVGSGKTLVAARAALAAVASGWQVAVMAPTELLAEQHHANFSTWFSSLQVKAELLLGRVKGSKRLDSLGRIAAGEAGVVIGTHALFQRDVRFHRLGLVIIDEQHRFGVHQRLSLRDKGDQGGLFPHQLIMTATPIPRTRAMVDYADLDVSIIDELPPGRSAVKTTATAADRRGEVIARIADWVARGRQAYWVCTLIDESEILQCEAAEKTAEVLRQTLQGIRIGLLHGRMKGIDKDAIMQSFKRRQLDLLVSTTVIEVGVDVPNAGLMVIENAERFGLAQLHQLRGRVGRGPGDSYCVLLYQPPLSQAARERLDTLRRSNDGFEIAEKDWALRGPGELLGTRQTGIAGFRTAELPRDSALLPRVAEVSERLIREEPAATEQLIRRWVGSSLHYAEV